MALIGKMNTLYSSGNFDEAFAVGHEIDKLVDVGKEAPVYACEFFFCYGMILYDK